jgi:hypothetical protein
MISDPVDCLRVDDQLVLNDKIRNILSDQFALVQHLMSFLLVVGNTAQAKLHAETIFINLLVQPVSTNVSMAQSTTAYTSLCNSNSCLLAFIRG